VIVTAETHQNEYLPAGGTDVDAIVTVTSTVTSEVASEMTSATTTAVVLVLDVSGSMLVGRKMAALEKAAAAAIAEIRDGVLFGVVAGTHEAVVVPVGGSPLVIATDATRKAAVTAVKALRAGGGTAIGRWLMEAYHLLAPLDGAIRQVILLTDGEDRDESRSYLDAVTRRCAGVFQCDCRGVGTDWRVDELRTIASALLGSVDIVARPRRMAADFRALMRGAMAKHTADVRLRLWTPRGTTIRFVRQVAPVIEDLTGRARVVDERTVDHPTGAWGSETRDFHIGLTVPAQAVGAEMLAGRVGVVVDAHVVSQSVVRAVWTEDVAASTQLHPQVAHYTGQLELASAIADGLAARRSGDADTATTRLGRAAQLAAESGNDGTLRLLARVVEIDDAATGTVRLRRTIDAADAMALDTRSTRTVRVGPGR
jgi:hypothetical protein